MKKFKVVAILLCLGVLLVVASTMMDLAEEWERLSNILFMIGLPIIADAALWLALNSTEWIEEE